MVLARPGDNSAAEALTDTVTVESPAAYGGARRMGGLGSALVQANVVDPRRRPSRAGKQNANVGAVGGHGRCGLEQPPVARAVGSSVSAAPEGENPAVTTQRKDFDADPLGPLVPDPSSGCPDLTRLDGEGAAVREGPVLVTAGLDSGVPELDGTGTPSGLR